MIKTKSDVTTGGKQDKIAETFVFDLMKSNWEEKIPRLQVIELTIDIVMSSSPNYNCAEALLKLVQLEKVGFFTLV